MAPFIKWLGGKHSVLNQIIPHIPKKFGTYHEPFLGGGALFFSLSPKTGILSDINEDLINTWLMVKCELDNLLSELEKLDSMKSEDDYYEVRRWNPNHLTDEERAARFIYLNKRGFNGLYRVNKRGEFNVPWGKREVPIYNEGKLRDCSKRLQNCSIVCADYSYVGRNAKPGDLVYFDPPYIPISETANFTAFTKDGFTESDQVALSELARDLVDAGVQVMASNSDSELSRELWQGFKVWPITTRRSISVGDRAPIKELLFTSWKN